MSITCKAAVIRNNKLAEPYKDSKPLSIEDIKISPPLENEVLVKVMGAGLCHSDLSVINGSRVMPLPLVIGHEGSGKWLSWKCVKDIKVGDHVAFQFSPSWEDVEGVLKEDLKYVNLQLQQKVKVI